MHIGVFSSDSSILFYPHSSLHLKIIIFLFIFLFFCLFVFGCDIKHHISDSYVKADPTLCEVNQQHCLLHTLFWNILEMFSEP